MPGCSRLISRIITIHFSTCASMRESEAPVCEAMAFAEVVRLSDMMGIPLRFTQPRGFFAREFDRFLRFFGLSPSQS